MCENCFEKEIHEFETYEHFDTFDLELTNKLGSSKMILIKDIFNERSLNNGYSIYKCQSCLKEWYLSIPDNAWRGYFLEKKSAIQRINKEWIESQKENKGCWISIFIFLQF